MINIKTDKYVILELIPDSFLPENGNILQISALKIDNLRLIDRFDYRLNIDKIKIKDFIKLLSYDQECFTYVDDDLIIKEKLSNWIEDYHILVIDDTYTFNYLEGITNSKELINNYLHLEKSVNVVDDIIKKYNLEASNHIVDLLYEALIYESNNL